MYGGLLVLYDLNILCSSSSSKYIVIDLWDLSEIKSGTIVSFYKYQSGKELRQVMHIILLDLKALSNLDCNNPSKECKAISIHHT